MNGHADGVHKGRILHTGEGLGFFKLHDAVRKTELSLHNRIKSIAEDIAFTEHLYTALPHIQFFANLRCGKWYMPESAPTAHFKSTDGHCHHWSIPWSRLNLHVAQAATETSVTVTVEEDKEATRALTSSLDGLVQAGKMKMLPFLSHKFIEGGSYSANALLSRAWSLAPDVWLERLTSLTSFPKADSTEAPSLESISKANLIPNCVVGLVDSTRKGKLFPDAFSRTLPYWCAVLNRSVLRFLRTSDMKLKEFIALSRATTNFNIEAVSKVMMEKRVSETFTQWVSSLVETNTSTNSFDLFADAYETKSQRTQSKDNFESTLLWNTQVRTPALCVSSIELSQMEEAVEQSVDAFIRDCGNRMVPLVTNFFMPELCQDSVSVIWKRKAGPLRPFWIQRDSIFRDVLRASASFHPQFGTAHDSLICLYSASRPETEADVEARSSRTAWVYVQGAGDDEENWASWRPRYLRSLIERLSSGYPTKSEDDQIEDGHFVDDYADETEETEAGVEDYDIDESDKELFLSDDSPEIRLAKKERYRAHIKFSKRASLTPSVFQNNAEWLCCASDNRECLERFFGVWQKEVKNTVKREFANSYSSDSCITYEEKSCKTVPLSKLPAITIALPEELSFLNLHVNVVYAPSNCPVHITPEKEDNVLIVAASSNLRSTIMPKLRPINIQSEPESTQLTCFTIIQKKVVSPNLDENKETKVSSATRTSDNYASLRANGCIWPSLMNLTKCFTQLDGDDGDGPDSPTSGLIFTNIPSGIGGKRERFILFNAITPILVLACKLINLWLEKATQIPPQTPKSLFTIYVTAEETGLGVAIMTALLLFLTKSQVTDDTMLQNIQRLDKARVYETARRCRDSDSSSKSVLSDPIWMSELESLVNESLHISETIVGHRGSLFSLVSPSPLPALAVKEQIQQVMLYLQTYAISSESKEVSVELEFGQLHPARLYIKQLNTYFCNPFGCP